MSRYRGVARIHGYRFPDDDNNMPEVLHSEEIRTYQRGGHMADRTIPTDQWQVYGQTTDRTGRSHRPGRGGRRPEHGL